MDYHFALPMVSIHAPVKGATPDTIVRHINYDVSIHAPVKGATVIIQSFQVIQRFNPRTRERCDVSVSHTRNTHVSFNPRTRERCDQRIFNKRFCAKCFNPRTRERCDLNLLRI